MARKAVLKRIKITKTGKLLRRHAGHNHFNAKESRKAHNRKQKLKGFTPTGRRNMWRYLQKTYDKS